MDVPKEIIKKNSVRDFARPVVFDLAFGLFSYVILFFILVSLVLPALAGQAGAEDVASPQLIFWISTAAILFVVQVFFADFTLKPLKHDGLRGGIIAGAMTVFFLIAAAPIIYSDDFSRSSLLNLSILLLAPFLGQVAGGWFVSRRAS